MDRAKARRPWFVALLRVVFCVSTGGVIWFAVIAFEEFVTADLRWVLWLGAALLFVAGAVFGALNCRAWAPFALAAPILVLYARIVVAGMPDLWAHCLLWPASGFAGWYVARFRSARSIGWGAALGLVVAAYGGWYIPQTLADSLNTYVDEPAPSFALQSLDGTPYPMETLEGKVVVLDFFATWCAPCIAELPEIEVVRDDLADREDIVFLIVGDGASGDSIEQIAEFARSSEMDTPFVYDPGGVAHDAFGFANIPALAVIDRDGNVRLRRVGFNAAETGFGSNLKRLLGEL